MDPKKKIIIVGARENGHPSVVFDAINSGDDYEVVGFIDENLNAEGTCFGLPAWPKKGFDLKSQKGRSFIIATGCGKTRNRLSDELTASGLHPANIIHPTAIISQSANLGVGIFIGPGAIINFGVVLGNNVLVNSGAIVEHDVEVDRGATVGPGVIIAGRAKVGIESAIGIGACIIQDISIGHHCKVAGNSLVKEDIPDNTRFNRSQKKIEPDAAD
jgi:sugar O-acyltransferase (sialic acid O-acetyltransferase NeuD family)